MENENEYGKAQSPFANSPYETYAAPQPQPAPSPAPRKKSSGKGWKAAIAVILSLALLCGGCGVTSAVLNSQWESRMEKLSLSLNQKIEALEKSIQNGSQSGLSGNTVSSDGRELTPSQVYEKCMSAVVAISNEVSQGGRDYQVASTGSGFFITEDGYVVSNFHVVSGADRLMVTTADGTTYEAKLIGGDETNDIAVMKVEAQGLNYLTIGSSDNLKVGSQVVAIGNPLGELSLTQTVGYVSGKDRDVTTDGTAINMIQTDAAINSGNSGGPLCDMNGHVVGITTAKYSGTTSSGASIEGIGFAIPIDDVKDMISDLMTYGYVTGAYLGVVVRDMNAAVAEMYHLPVGAHVDEVTPGSCAEKGGIQAGDIITVLGGYEVESINDLNRALRKFKAGDQVSATVYRAGREVILTLTLDEKPQNPGTQPSQEPDPTMPEMPTDGSYEDWYNYFFHFFGGGKD